jgi:hypothetical protein
MRSPPELPHFEVEAEIVELRTGDEEVVLRLPDGRDLEAWLPEELVEAAHSSARVDVYLSEGDRLVGWFLPEHNIGVLQE